VVGRLDRALVRRRFEERFSAVAMAQRYLDLYARLGFDAGCDLPAAAVA
jgi:hypothetical protein